MRWVEFECAPDIAALFESAAADGPRFLIEDVPAGAAIMGARPSRVLTAKNGSATIAAGGSETRLSGDPLSALSDLLAAAAAEYRPCPAPFAGGAVGWFSYDLGRSIESVPDTALEDVSTPDFCLGFFDSALCVDLRARKCTAVSWSSDVSALDYWQEQAMRAPESAPPSPAPVVRCVGDPVELRCNFTREGYLRAIRRIQDYIRAGDVYQVNLAQRFEAELPSGAWPLYRALRRVNPAPKSCYMELGHLTLASASPETFVTYDPLTRRAVTKPIKGTRPRSGDPDEDTRLARELAASEKDRAENVMIVDMERNDLGRVAEFGSVRVTRLWDIEKHPNVFQMVSTVEATLREDCGPVDLLRAAFPGGSITGAPKVRAMQIIEELEPHRRGIYTGSAGFIDYRGVMDLSIVIRSFVVDGSKAWFHGGGGILIDSNPESEYQETLDKVCGLRVALRDSRGRQ